MQNVSVSWGACPHYEPLNKNNVEMEDNAYKLKATSCTQFCTLCLSICYVIVYKLQIPVKRGHVLCL